MTRLWTSCHPKSVKSRPIIIQLLATATVLAVANGLYELKIHSMMIWALGRRNKAVIWRPFKDPFRYDKAPEKCERGLCQLHSLR